MSHPGHLRKQDHQYWQRQPQRQELPRPVVGSMLAGIAGFFADHARAIGLAVFVLMLFKRL